MSALLKLFLVSALSIAALTATANDEHHPADSKAKATQVTKDKAASAQLQKLQTARDKLAAAKTPAERNMAMQESMMMMKDTMSMMHDMHKDKKGCMDMEKSVGKEGMSEHMGMMQMMMQMMEQQANMLKMPM